MPQFAVGNVFGGAIFVALLFWYTYGHSAEKRQALIRGSGLVRQQEERAGKG